MRYGPPLDVVEVDRIREAARRRERSLAEHMCAGLRETERMLSTVDWSHEYVYELTHEDILRALEIS